MIRLLPSAANCVTPVVLFAAFAVAGLVAAVSLLLRHWKSIEATAAPPQQFTAQAAAEAEPLGQPLLEQVCFIPAALLTRHVWI